MKTSEWITIIGWPISLIGTTIGSYIVARRTRERRILSWSVVSVATVVDPELMRRVEKPIRVLVDNNIVEELTLTVLRFGNTGNRAINEAVIRVYFSDNTTLHDVRLTSDSQLFKEQVAIERTGNESRLHIRLLNPGQRFEVECPISASDGESIPKVDALAQNLQLEEKDPAVPMSLLKTPVDQMHLSMKIPLLGSVSYDPTVSVFYRIERELRFLRRYFERQVGKDE